jgi:NAD(P)-dependent dehydrogenase (short-subunit alcohol dehydrogenase family)
MADVAMPYAGKVAVVTGGARGFGLGFVRALTSEGASAVIADVDIEEAQRAAALLQAQGASVLAVACDVTNEVAVQAAMQETVKAFGGLDILINNAGLHLNHYSRPFTDLPRVDTRAVFEVNVMGVINCSVAARPFMRERGGGVILNLASIAGYSLAGPYGVSKLAVRGLTVSLAREFAPDGIRVNSVAPGLTATETVMGDLPTEMVEQFVNDLQLIKRLGQPKDIIEAAMFLCSPRASFITGETLRVSGGFPLSI